MLRLIVAALLAGLFVVPNFAIAGGADVTDVKATRSANGTWRFDVTVSHADEGWEHYANSWQVLSVEGKVLATRVLAHPHVDEQPFTRSKSGVSIPEGMKEVVVRAGDLVHGYSGREVRVRLND